MDTSAPVEDPHKPREVEFELKHTGSLTCIHLTEGTYTQGARLGSPFRTDRKRHVLSVRTPERSQPFVIDYGSICAIASENEAALYIPWNLWKHKTTPLDRDIEHTMALEVVGPRVLEIRKKAYQGPSLRSFDFTPGACRFTKQIDTSLDDTSRYAIRRAKLTDVFPEGRMVWWYFSEDNVLAFTVCLVCGICSERVRRYSPFCRSCPRRSRKYWNYGHFDWGGFSGVWRTFITCSGCHPGCFPDNKSPIR
jgi:hypothetical protein